MWRTLGARRILSSGRVHARLAQRLQAWGRQPAKLVQTTLGDRSERIAIANVQMISGSEKNEAKNRKAKIPGNNPDKFKKEALLNVVRKCHVELAPAQALAVTHGQLLPLAVIGGDFNLLPKVVAPTVSGAMRHYNCKRPVRRQISTVAIGSSAPAG